MTDRIGQQLGNYQLIQLLGQGRWASVYLGEHQHLHTQAAIKVLSGPWTDHEVEGFLNEARTLARLRHPHIVRVLDFGVQEGTPFLVMEYAPGGTLRQLHPKGTRLPLNTVISYVKQVASALQYAHAQRLIHRDLKPENLLLGPDQEVWLSDFGLALVAHSAHSQSFQQTAGTLAYMAPEQLEGHPTPASDQYALGVLVYEWLAGERPFSGSLTELAVKQVLAPPPALTKKVPTLPAVVDLVVLQALAKDPEQRFANVQAFALALQEADREQASGQTIPLLVSDYSVEVRRRAASTSHLPKGTVTLLFTDIEGSTSLLQHMGERYTQVLGECRRLLRAAFQHYHGREVDTQGDAFFVVFARATNAVSAAVAAQRALARQSWTEGMTVHVRMGVHTGEPALTPEGYVGLDVHRAARIMSVAHGGQILLSQSTRELVEHELPAEVSLRDLGEHRLKDLQRPAHLFQVVSADLPADFPPLKTLGNAPNNLPIQPTPLVGRVQEMRAICTLMHRDEVRLVTLTGPGGIGKTRMALQVAAELSESFADGVFFVDLAPLRDPSLVLSSIAQTIGMQEAAGQSLLERLAEGLQQKHRLLLLDNFEQVLSAARQVADLLSACPSLKVLATSRERLHVRAEHEFAVPPLSLPDPNHLPELAVLAVSEAVALFLERAKATQSDFQLVPTNARAIAEICVRLDGLPLAIELAAARSKLLSPQALLARLGQRLTVLTSGARDVPARHQTLRHTIAWSYSLLDAQEQRLLRRLAVFVGGCTLEAVEALSTGVGDTEVDMLDSIASLVDKSLLQRAEQDGDEPRFAMLETIREYGLEALVSSGEMEDTRQAHAAYYLGLAEEAEPELAGPQQAEWLERLEREYDNLRAAMQWSLEPGEEGHRREMALRLGGALRRLWIVHGHWSEGRNFLERALAESKGVPAAVQVKAIITAANLANMQADTDRAEVLAEKSRELCQELGDTRGLALSLRLLAVVATRRGDLAAARSLNEEALMLFREVGDQEGAGLSLHNLGWLAMIQGEYAKGRALFEESLALHRQVGNKEGMARSLIGLAVTLINTEGDPATIRALLEESLALSQEVGYREGIEISFFVSGQLALSQGDIATARELVEKSLVINREIGNREDIAYSLFLLARVEARQGHYAAACALYEQCLAMAIEGNSTWNIDLFLQGLAGVVAAQGEPAWAARLYGADEAFRDANSRAIIPVYRAEYEHSVAATRAQLGEQAFAATWAEGRTMTPEQALAARGPMTMPTLAPSEPSTVPHAPKAATYPDGLTTREVEVLRLLARGLSNTQIAEELVVSLLTVKAHLRSIYSKLGVTSRSAATRYALERDLS